MWRAGVAAALINQASRRLFSISIIFSLSVLAGNIWVGGIKRRDVA